MATWCHHVDERRKITINEYLGLKKWQIGGSNVLLPQISCQGQTQKLGLEQLQQQQHTSPWTDLFVFLICSWSLLSIKVFSRQTLLQLIVICGSHSCQFKTGQLKDIWTWGQKTQYKSQQADTLLSVPASHSNHTSVCHFCEFLK